MGFNEIFKLNKSKIVIDFLISALMAIVIFINPNFLYKFVLLTKHIYWQIGWILINLFVSMIIYYPLSCGLLFVYGRLTRKKKKTKKNSWYFAIAAILLLNPLTFSLIYDQIISNKITNAEDCNVIITEFANESPAESAGMQVGEIITEVNGYKINNLDSLAQSLADKRARDSIIVKTNLKEYEIVTIIEPNSGRAMLGIKVGELCGL